ncbi:TonB-dependent receptor plug domain-containing protein [Steroidobacter sp.]|uniref:TonB-dependent receptor plug domain-containing protein n=1 Tax=Steroidobacter sp. TaxID=1978227 RepID=UPI002EDB364D
MSKSQLGRRIKLLMSVCFAALLSVGSLRAEDGKASEEEIKPDTLVKFNIPRLPLIEALERFTDALSAASFEGLNPDDHQRAPNIVVGPVRGRMTPAKAFDKLARDVCAEHRYEERDVPLVTLQDVPITYQSRSKRPEAMYGYLDLGRMTRLAALQELEKQFGIEILWAVWVPRRDEQGRTQFVPASYVLDLVGPITGEQSIFMALTTILKGTGMLGRWVGGGRKPLLLIEPAKKRFVVGDCQENVLVTERNLSSLDVDAVKTLDRQRLEELGVATVPDALRYISQTAFTRPRGHRLSGAQFAELRGLGAAHTKILINGRPADASAPDLAESAAFDLNTIPMSAVERIEISADVPSLLHGADAIGGVVNIVLRESIETPHVAVRYGAAESGGSEWTGTIAGGTNGDELRSAAVLEVFDGAELLGFERDRWRNQDFRRFGGRDHRLLLATPPNVRSIDGLALPGLNSAFAAVAAGPDGSIQLIDGAQNRTSLLAWQAIRPAVKRTTLSTRADFSLNRATVRGEAMIGRRSSTFRLVPALVPGLILGRDHPQNPFGVDVQVDAALTGLQRRQHRVTSELGRGVLEIEGKLRGSWGYSLFGLYSEDRAKSWRENTVDTLALMESLSGAAEHSVDIFSLTPGAGASSLLVPAKVDHYQVGSRQFTAKMSGDLLDLPAGAVSASLGAQARNAFARFHEQVGRVERDIHSGFGVLNIPALDRFNLSLGARRDFYSDVGPITRMQYGVTWRPARIELHAVYSEAFNAPTHFELYLPRFEVPYQTFDAQRQEIASLRLICRISCDWTRLIS